MAVLIMRSWIFGRRLLGTIVSALTVLATGLLGTGEIRHCRLGAVYFGAMPLLLCAIMMEDGME